MTLDRGDGARRTRVLTPDGVGTVIFVRLPDTVVRERSRAKHRKPNRLAWVPVNWCAVELDGCGHKAYGYPLHQVERLQDVIDWEERVKAGAARPPADRPPLPPHPHPRGPSRANVAPAPGGTGRPATTTPPQEH